MTRFFRNVVSAAALAIMVILPLSPAGAADVESQPESAQVTLRATGANWQTDFEFASAVLTVSGPDDVVLRKEFAAGDAIELNLADAASGGLPDGQYTWELRFSPRTSQSQKDRLRAARESGDDAAITELKSKHKLPIEVAPWSGYFRVSGGNVVVADRTEMSARRVSPQAEGDAQPGVVNDQDAAVATKDQVILDDLIVDGSICVGFDCINGESFGFDTLRLKENNTRIKFQDTSNSASFPSNDWQLTANDSSNGGANKFSIDDIDGGRTPFTIEAGAPSHSLYLDDGGRLGLGTSTPVVDIHVKSGNTPTLRLEQDGSSGFTAQTWDVAGNETNFFVRDATNGSTLPFRILPGAESDTLVISGNDNVGIGVGTSPQEKLHIKDNTSVVKIKMTNTASAQVDWAFALSSADEFRISKQGSGGPEFTIAGDGTVKIGPGASTVYRLTPTGDIIISGSLTQNGTPDYVFDEGYQLMPLDDLSDFIDSNGHLPNIPSADDVATNGLSTTKLQFGLLEKIEELTLYTLEQEKLIRQLEERLAGLEERSE